MTTKLQIKTTCPRDCYDACGIVVIKRNGIISKVLGDPAHHRSRGALCGKCALAYNGAWRDQELRLNEPLKRIGPKGENKFEVISWEQALNEIAIKLKEIKKDSKEKTILHTHYTGTCSLIAGNFPVRFFNKLGATEIDPDTVCNKAGHEALKHIFGNSFYGFDPKGIKNTDCLIIWGANPSATAPHINQHWLKELPEHAKLIVVDPIKHETAKNADIHLQLRPGTDAVLAFAILHILIRDEMFNQSFIDTHVLGWGEIRKDIENSTPEWAEEVTGVKAELIEMAAKYYGKNNSMLWLGQGVQRQMRAGNVFRAISLLPIATGNLGRTGTGILYMNSFMARGVDMDWVNATNLRENTTTAISHMDLVEVLNDPSRSSALITWNNNIAASSPQQKQLKEALKREDLLLVAVDIFNTDTTKFADYILPASSFLEFDDVVVSYFDYTVSAQVKAMDPIGNSLPNQEIFRKLADAMGYQDEELHESDKMLIWNLLNQLNCKSSFAELSEVGTIDWKQEEYIPFSDGVFPTASGKIEVTSETWVKLGLDASPQPNFDEPAPLDMLRVLSPAADFLMNSSYANDKRIQNRLGEQTVYLNPVDMHKYSLQAKSKVRLFNETGELTVYVDAQENVPIGVALLHKGFWPSNSQSDGNVNILNSGCKTDLGESSAVHNIHVRIESL